MSKHVLRILSADFSSAALVLGYLIGLLVPLILGEHLIDLCPLGTSSPFLSGEGDFFDVLCIQSVYPIIIFLLGFIPCARLLSASAVFIRSSLASYSSLALCFLGADIGEYLLHTVTGLALSLVCWAISKCTSDAQGAPSLYTMKFLFFSGIFFIILFCRSVALAFV